MVKRRRNYRAISVTLHSLLYIYNICSRKLDNRLRRSCARFDCHSENMRRILIPRFRARTFPFVFRGLYMFQDISKGEILQVDLSYKRSGFSYQ